MPVTVTQPYILLEPDFLKEDPAEYMPTLPLPGIGGLKLRKSASIPPPSGAPRRAVPRPRPPTPGPDKKQKSTLGSPGDNLSGRSSVDYLGLLPTVEEVRRRSVGSPVEAAPPPVPRELHVRPADVVSAPAPRPPPRPTAPVDLEAKEFVGALRRRGLILGLSTAGGTLLGSLLLVLVANLGGSRDTRPEAAVERAVSAPAVAPAATPAPAPEPATAAVTSSDTNDTNDADSTNNNHTATEAAPRASKRAEPRSATAKARHKRRRQARRSRSRRRSRSPGARRAAVNADALLEAGTRRVDADALLAAARPSPAPRSRRRKDRSGFVMPSWAR